MGRVFYCEWRHIQLGWRYPAAVWVRRHINTNEAFAFYDLLRAYCSAHPGTLRGTQIRVDVDNRWVVLALKKCWPRTTHIHELLVSRFQFQVPEGFWLRLRWVPTQDNTDADRMTRLGVEEFVRLHLEVFRRVWQCLGPFQ